MTERRRAAQAAFAASQQKAVDEGLARIVDRIRAAPPDEGVRILRTFVDAAIDAALAPMKERLTRVTERLPSVVTLGHYLTGDPPKR